MKNIILFASGGGSNVKAILQYFADQPTCSFPLVVTNNAKAGVIDVARSFGVDVAIITREIFEEPVFLDTLDFFKPDLLVLAGFFMEASGVSSKKLSQSNHQHTPIIAAGLWWQRDVWTSCSRSRHSGQGAKEWYYHPHGE
jgi:hypothetical protein